MSTASAPEQAASVPGELHYLAPGSTVLRRFTDSIEVRTFAFFH